MVGVNHPIERKRRRTPSEIKELLNRYRHSQLPQAQFVRVEGVCLASLRNYIKREAVSNAAVGAAVGAAAGGRFIEVERENAFPEICGRQSCQLYLKGGFAVEVPPGFCSREVASLLALISTAGAR